MSRRRVMLLVATAGAVACGALGAGIALAVTGGSWSGTGVVGSDGTLFYSATGQFSQTEVQAVNKNSLTFTLTDNTTGKTYTITATGRLFQSVNPNQEYPPFGFTASGATLRDSSGTTRCTKGQIVAGGFHNAFPNPPNSDVHDFMAEVTFPSSCKVLPGHQYVEVWDLPPYSHYANIWKQR